MSNNAIVTKEELSMAHEFILCSKELEHLNKLWRKKPLSSLLKFRIDVVYRREQVLRKRLLDKDVVGRLFNEKMAIGYEYG